MASRLPKIEMRKVGEVSPYARNARTHSADQVAQIAASIDEFGWTSPILIAESGEIIAGHGRLLALESLYREGREARFASGEPIPAGMVPVIVARGWSDAQKRAYVLADNQIAANAGWDEALLRVELGDLRDEGFDLGVIGFAPDELERLMAPAGTLGATDPDDVPDAPADPVTRPGDVWLLGRHRIICGDSTDADVVERVLAGVKPHLMVTDPPYGVNYDANWRNEAARTSKGMGNRALGAGAVGVVLNDNRADWHQAWALFPGDVAYVWHAGLFAGLVAESLQATGFKIRSQIIWAKSTFTIGRGDYHWHHEPCWYAVREKATGHWNGDRKQSTLWQIPKPQKSETGHSTQKPVECMQRPIENNSSPGQAVYEPFSGSGTTIIACEATGRCCLAIELNPVYVDVAVTRWQQFTGEAAVLEGAGRTFSEIGAERLGKAANGQGEAA